MCGKHPYPGLEWRTGFSLQRVDAEKSSDAYKRLLASRTCGSLAAILTVSIISQIEKKVQFRQIRLPILWLMHVLMALKKMIRKCAILLPLLV